MSAAGHLQNEPAQRGSRTGMNSPLEASTREIYFFNLYRLLEAAIYTGLVFSPLTVDWISLSYPRLGQICAIGYLAFAIVMLVFSGLSNLRPRSVIGVALLVDVIAASALLIALTGSHTAIPIMLLVNIGGAALWLSLEYAIGLATLGTVGICLPAFLPADFGGGAAASSTQPLLYGVAYLAAATICYFLGRHMRATEALAEQRGVDLLNLEQINDLIIRRMKTGVLLVDDNNHILRINESAWALIGTPPADQRDLGAAAPELSRRIYHWRSSGKNDQTSVELAPDVPAVIPRFTRLAPNDDNLVLIFLDDTSLFSRRAEELTLTSLGRLSASIAHEIRNPLAAISYSAQLLQESPGLGEEDKRLVEIINNHCTRANDVVENILQLSRRERSRPEIIDVNGWARRFVEEFLESNDVGKDQLVAIPHNGRVEVMADPQHLQQVVWNLVQNALRYGREPGMPARVALVARMATERGPALLEVTDRGPGIPPKVAAQIFEPFYTTHEFGTGLGLYLARQMAEACQATLEYVAIAGGGACFRLTLAPATTLTSNRPMARSS